MPLKLSLQYPDVRDPRRVLGCQAPIEAPTPGACSRLETHLRHELVGQGPAVEAATDAICAHLADKDPPHPLLISIHGPPGVGKTLFHKLLAESLYNLTDGLHTCPGSHCPAYKVRQFIPAHNPPWPSSSLLPPPRRALCLCHSVHA